MKIPFSSSLLCVILHNDLFWFLNIILYKIQDFQKKKRKIIFYYQFLFLFTFFKSIYLQISFENWGGGELKPYT